MAGSTPFDFTGVPGVDGESAPLNLAAGEVAQARFTTVFADNLWFSVVRNGVATRQPITNRQVASCDVIGPAVVTIAARFSAPNPRVAALAANRVAGILETLGS